MSVGGQRHALAVLPSGKTRYPLYNRLGGPQGRSGRVRKFSPPTGIRSPDRPASLVTSVLADNLVCFYVDWEIFTVSGLNIIM